MFEIIANRGSDETAPANTITAFEHAIDKGADGIMFGVQLTADGIPVVYHDRFLVNSTDPNCAIFAHTLADLKALPLVNAHGHSEGDHHLHRFYEVVGSLGLKTRYVIEINGPEPELIFQFISLMKDFKYLWDHIEVVSQEPVFLLELSHQLPSVTLGLIYPRFGERRADLVAHLIWQRARLARTTNLYLHPSQLYPDLISMLSEQKYNLQAWNVNTPDALQMVLSRGIRRFSTTNLPVAMDYRQITEASNDPS